MYLSTVSPSVVQLDLQEAQQRLSTGHGDGDTALQQRLEEQRQRLEQRDQQLQKQTRQLADSSRQLDESRHQLQLLQTRVQQLQEAQVGRRSSEDCILADGRRQNSTWRHTSTTAAFASARIFGRRQCYGTSPVTDAMLSNLLVQ